MLIDGQHNDRDTYEDQNASKQVRKSIGNEFLNIGNVTGHTLDKVSLFVFAVPIQRETLQVFKQLVTQAC